MKKYPMGTVASESRRRLLAGVAGVGAMAAFGLAGAGCPARQFRRARAGRTPRRHARRAALRYPSGQGSADQEDLPPAEFRDPAQVFPNSDHAERCVLRALAPRRHSRTVGQGLEAHGRRRERRARTDIHARAAEEGIQTGRNHRGVAVLGQPPRPVRAARCRRRVGRGRHGQRGMARCAPARRAGESRAQGQCARGGVQRRGDPAARRRRRIS